MAIEGKPHFIGLSIIKGIFRFKKQTNKQKEFPKVLLFIVSDRIQSIPGFLHSWCPKCLSNFSVVFLRPGM